jgi:hypothetical protein
LGRSQGHVPLLAARVAPQSTAYLAIAIMSVSMFDLATTRHDGEGLFVWLVIPHPVELGSLIAPLLMQWNVKLEEAFIFTLSGLPPLLMMPCPHTFISKSLVSLFILRVT